MLDPATVDVSHVSVSLVAVGGAIASLLVSMGGVISVVWIASSKAARIESCAERIEGQIKRLETLPEGVAVLNTRMGTLESSTSTIVATIAKHGSYITNLRERVAKMKGEATGRFHVVPNGNGEDE